MQEKDKPRESPITKLSDIINVPTSDPEDARRRRLLNAMLLGVAVAALLMLVALLVTAPMGLAGAAEEVRGLYLGIVLVLLGAVAIYALNHYLSGKLAAAIFVLLLVALAAITDEPRQVVDGRGLLVFAVPILAAGALLAPWASFAAAGLSSLVVIIIGLAVVKQAIPNVPAIVSFFVLALVIYIFSRSLGRALKSLRAANEALQAGEDAYRQRLLLALSQAAQAVQRARTPGQVYHIVGDEIRKLGYHALVFTVTDDGEHLSLAHLTLESALLRKAEQLTGLRAQEYRIAITPESFAGRSFIEKRAFFCERVADSMGQDFPSSIRPLAGRVAAILGLKQIVFAPLVVEDEAIGLLEVVGVGLTEADVPAVSVFANQTAIALENALLYRQARGHAEEMERRVAERTQALESTQAAAFSMMRDAEEARKVAEQANEELSLLYEASRQLNRTLDLEKVYDTLHQLASRRMDCDGMFVSSYNPQDNLIRCVYNWHEGKPSEVSHLPPIPLEPEGYGIQSSVIRTGQPLLVPDYVARLNQVQTSYHVDKDGNVVDQVPDDAERTRSAIVVPLKLEGKVQGAIQVFSYRKDAYTEAHVRFLEALALQVGVAAQNASLYRQAQDEITERKQAEEKLKQTLAELATSRAAALNMMADAEEARRATEQANTDLRREIEERKRVEAELQRSNIELEQFVYVASHDLQEPLRKVQAFGDRLGTKYASALDERGHDYLERMRGAARRMQEMINDLLALSRIAARAQPFVPVNLRQTADEAISDLEIRIERTGGRVEVGDLPTIEAEPTQMRQLLENLIGNGLKFHRDGVVPVVKVYGKVTDDDRCQIFVEDNGIGFDEKYLDRIFQPFQRLHGRSAYEGSGIGLAICRKIVERHGGSITARSAPGEGATFIVTLPVKQGSREYEVGSKEKRSPTPYFLLPDQGGNTL